MLFEAITYLTTRCPQPYRRMGYLTELIATDARHKRCKDAWQPHLDKTKATILKAMDVTSQRRHAVVLGCGILCDIPIHALAQNFEKVSLVDICLLNSTKKRIARYPNVKWQLHDVTGMAVPIADMAEDPISTTVQAPKPLTDTAIKGADLVISANILSQLPMIPVAYLTRKRSDLSSSSINSFAARIVAQHLHDLARCQGTLCLISEIERQFICDHSIIDSDDPFWGHEATMPGEEWTWDIAPKSETGNDYAVRNRIKGAIWRSDTPKPVGLLD